MTPRQDQIYRILQNFADTDGNATVSLASLGFPDTPDFINTCEQDLTVIQTAEKIGSFERFDSRKFNIKNIT